MSEFKHVELLHKFNCANYYSSTCSCGSHFIHVVVSCDEEFELLTLHTETRLGDWRYDDEDWFLDKWKKFLFRVRSAIQILALGYIETEQEFIFEDENHAQDFVDAITEGIERMKEIKRLEEEKQKKVKLSKRDKAILKEMIAEAKDA